MRFNEEFIQKKSQTSENHEVSLHCKFAFENLKKFPEIMYFSSYDFTCEIIEMKSILISVGEAYTILFLQKFWQEFYCKFARWPIEYPLPLSKSKTSSGCSHHFTHACMSLFVQLELLRYRIGCQASADTAKGMIRYRIACLASADAAKA